MNKFPMIVAASAALVLALTACSAPKPTDSGKTPDTAPAAGAASPSPSAPGGGSEYGASEKSSRGNLIKKIGQLAGTSSLESDVTTSRFAVTDLKLDLPCTNQYAQPSKNGHFLGIHVNVETTPELAKEQFPWLMFTSYDWQAYDADGKRLNDPQGNGYSCLDSSEVLPSKIGPGESVSGWIVLDVAAPTGAVAFTMAGSSTGWEWSY
ncbi:MAG: hypothetical protein JST33_02770 [Actinobacteria bacterium]|nr:hypothetical protein [Actinomycetota bacterium]